jgi:hypothetical protein
VGAVFGDPAVMSDGTIYWAGFGGAALYRGSADGQTWTEVATGASGAIQSPIAVSATAIAIQGSQTIQVSNDKGAHWTPATALYPAALMAGGPDGGEQTPEDLHGIAYLAQQSALYVWHQTECPGGMMEFVLPSDAVQSFAYTAP